MRQNLESGVVVESPSKALEKETKKETKAKNYDYANPNFASGAKFRSLFKRTGVDQIFKETETETSGIRNVRILPYPRGHIDFQLFK